MKRADGLYRTQEQLNELSIVIGTELLKRGFVAKIETIEEKVNRGNHSIKLESEDFQTTPVLFRNLKVIAFNSAVFETEDEQKDNKVVVGFHIGVYVAYTHFSLGGNSSELFTITGKFSEKSVYSIKIK